MLLAVIPPKGACKAAPLAPLLPSAQQGQEIFLSPLFFLPELLKGRAILVVGTGLVSLATGRFLGGKGVNIEGLF